MPAELVIPQYLQDDLEEIRKIEKEINKAYYEVCGKKYICTDLQDAYLLHTVAKHYIQEQKEFLARLQKRKGKDEKGNIGTEADHDGT